LKEKPVHTNSYHFDWMIYIVVIALHVKYILE